MAIRERMLGQLRPADLNAATLYTKPSDKIAICKSIFVCNTTANPRVFRVFVDNTGSGTYDQTTALFYDVAIAANTTTQITAFIALSTTGGRIGVRTDAANELTFTAFGAEID